MSKEGKVNERVDQMWMCVRASGDRVDMTDIDTLKWTRKESIAQMTYTKSGRPAYTWQQLRKYGWRCIKVNLSFEL